MPNWLEQFSEERILSNSTIDVFLFALSTGGKYFHYVLIIIVANSISENILPSSDISVVSQISKLLITTCVWLTTDAFEQSIIRLNKIIEWLILQHDSLDVF